MPYEAMSAETVNLRGHEDDLIDAYLARPTGPGPHPGVVVIHHMPGWDEATKEIARKFAHHGYIAISPNLHCREGKGTPEENSASIRAAGGMPDERTMGDVACRMSAPWGMSKGPSPISVPCRISMAKLASLVIVPAAGKCT